MQVMLFNSLNPSGKGIPVTINIEHVDVTQTSDGELIYLVTLSTGAKSISGSRVDPIYLNNVSKDSLLKEIERGLSLIGEQIDWGILLSDTAAPIIESIEPVPNASGVSMHSNVLLKLRDPFPASFIDKDTLQFKVNTIDVTPEVQVIEKEGRLKLAWVPKRIFKK